MTTPFEHFSTRRKRSIRNSYTVIGNLISVPFGSEYLPGGFVARLRRRGFRGTPPSAA